MARIRTIKPDYWKSEKLAARCPGQDGREARRMFVGLWNLAEDHGVCRGAPAYIRAELYPYDLDVTTEDVARWVALLIAGGFVTRFVRDGSTYLWIRGFADHQRINRPSKPSLPEPTDVEKQEVEPSREGSVRTHGGLSEGSLLEGKGSGREVEREKEVEREPARPVAADIRPPPESDSGAGFFADAQDLRIAKGLPAEAPPKNPDKLSRWYGPALAQFGGDRAWMLSAFGRFLADPDPYWRNVNPPLPFSAFAKTPEKWAGAKPEALPTCEATGCESTDCASFWGKRLCYAKHLPEAQARMAAGVSP